jgi:hypothetical protein
MPMMRGGGWRIDGDGGGSCCAQDTSRKYVASETKYSILFGLFWNPIAFRHRFLKGGYARNTPMTEEILL